MKIWVRHAWCVAAVPLVMSCARREPVTLTVDFTTRDSWVYEFNVSVGGKVAMRDSTAACAHAIHGRLTGIPDTADPSALTVTTGDVVLESSMLDEDEKENMRRLLDNFTISFSLRNGLNDMSDSLKTPLMPAGQWDLYRHFAKMLPVLPEGRVRPGYTWERHAQVPLPTSHGDAVGHLYQSFRFDSLTGRAPDHGRYAHLSWQFSYAIETGHTDTAGLLDEIPHTGSGAGSATVDVDAKSLREAAVEFTIPQDSKSDVFSIEWNEKAWIKIVE